MLEGTEGNDFSFPFEPYPQQRALMNSIVECIKRLYLPFFCSTSYFLYFFTTLFFSHSNSIGCFESPTGTGKSLSIICASLSWLIHEERKILDEVEKLTTPVNAEGNSCSTKKFKS